MNMTPGNTKRFQILLILMRFLFFDRSDGKAEGWLSLMVLAVIAGTVMNSLSKELR